MRGSSGILSEVFSYDFVNNYIKKVHIFISNYHSIDNIRFNF